MYTRSVVALVRKQVYISAVHEAFLKRQARELRVTEAELIRRSLDALQLEHPAAAPPADPMAWEEERRFMQERAQAFPPSQAAGRSWERAELYEERLARLPR